MSDNIHLPEHRERVPVTPAGSYELGFLESKLGVSRHQVLAAIKAVGNDRIKVASYLRSSLSKTSR